jgi:hypothetical protein
MQRAADFQTQITDPRLPQAARVVDNTATLHATIDGLYADAAARHPSIGGFRRPREGSAPWLLGRHDDLDVVERERQEAQILEQPAPCGQGVGHRIGNPLLVGTAGRGLTQKEDRERGVDEQHVVPRVVSVLAAITARLLKRLLGALEAPFSAVVAKRGEVGTEAGAGADGSAGIGNSSVGTTRAAASASAPPRRFANACTQRVGASPSGRSVARRTTKRTWIH